MNNTLQKTASIPQFVELVNSGIELWSQAGGMLVHLVADNPNIYSEIISKHPHITFEMLLAFERMGRRQLYPALLMDSSPAAKRLLQLPYEAQEKFCKEPVEVVTEDGGHGLKTVKKYLKELSTNEANQVFDVASVRDIEGQRLYIKSHKPIGRPVKRVEPKSLGVFLLKLSPSGALVAEKASQETQATVVKLFAKNGTKQCLINVVE